MGRLDQLLLNDAVAQALAPDAVLQVARRDADGGGVAGCCDVVAVSSSNLSGAEDLEQQLRMQKNYMYVYGIVWRKLHP